MKSLSFRLVLPALLGAGLSAHAQTPSPYVGEAVYYSRLQFGGPARTQGIAGANVALGADFGNLSSNPAGLGLFRKSEFHFTPGLGLGSADASGTGPAQNQTKNSFHIASLGAVLTNRLADDDASSDWRGGSFALGFSRLADYNTAVRYTEQVDVGKLVNGQVQNDRSFLQYLREPGGYTVVGSDEYQKYLHRVSSQGRKGQYYNLDGLAYGTYLTSIYPVRNSPSRDSAIVATPGLNHTLPVTQSETITRSGSVSQFDLGYGGSYKNRLFIGGAIGIFSANNRMVRDFTEIRNTADTTRLARLALHDENKTVGTGVNARIGLIYRVSDVLRVGASVQTPTYIQFTETYQQSLTSVFSPALKFPDGSIERGLTASYTGQYAYTLTTPFRANGGIALTFGKHGFVTADAEYLGYQQARLNNNPSDPNGDESSFDSDNEIISATYQNAVNLRLGAEARFGIFRLRGGYAHYGDPYRNSTIERTQEFYTGGLGFRTDGFFLDVAGVYTTFTQLYSPYTLAGGQQPVINASAKRYTTTVTAGFTF